MTKIDKLEQRVRKLERMFEVILQKEMLQNEQIENNQVNIKTVINQMNDALQILEIRKKIDIDVNF